MAVQPPTPQSLQSCEEAFVNYPLPTVRALERDLRKSIDENKTKLRSLVGASYRDLLGTAERIIEMEGQMKVLERGLGDMGKRCDGRSLEKVGENWARMRKERHGLGAKEAAIAQTKVLQGCLFVVGRVVRSKGDALLGAKVLVLARLLVKSIGEGEHAPGVLGELRIKLGVLRKKSLLYVERTMTKAGTEKALLARTLCAYALVTSSTPKEVLRQFLQVRFRQLENKAEAPGEQEIMQALDLYSQTLLDTKDLFPRRFADALSQLAKAPLLRDQQVQAVHELNLDIYGQWIAEDVRAFTPWVRHDQLASSEVGDALTSWTKQAHECLSGGLVEYLEQQDDISAVVQSRGNVVSRFMALSSKLRSQTHVKAIDGVREAFLERMTALAGTAATLPDLELGDKGASTGSRPSERKDSLWDLAEEDMDLGNGAQLLRKAVLHRRHGRDDRLVAGMRKLDTWVKRIDALLDEIDHMRASQWDDDLDFDLDDFDDGDELHDNLSKKDPEYVLQSLRKAAEASISSTVDTIVNAGGFSNDPAYLLRLWRELNTRVQSLRGRITLPPTTISLRDTHRNLALSICNQAADDYIRTASATSHVATTLWDGTPPLPVQLSPVTFKFLSTLHRAMSEAGDDLWSVECVGELQELVRERLGESLFDSAFDEHAARQPTNGHDQTVEDGEGSDTAADQKMVSSPLQDTNKDRLLQNLFDVLYLRHVFPSDAGANASGLGKVIEETSKRAELDAVARQRLERSAKEYWKRTYLLFGLLAGRARDT